MTSESVTESEAVESVESGQVEVVDQQVVVGGGGTGPGPGVAAFVFGPGPARVDHPIRGHQRLQHGIGPDRVPAASATRVEAAMPSTGTAAIAVTVSHFARSRRCCILPDVASPAIAAAAAQDPSCATTRRSPSGPYVTNGRHPPRSRTTTAVLERHRTWFNRIVQLPADGRSIRTRR